MSAIESVHAGQILDGPGNPTVEVDVRLTGGATGHAAVPTGASPGTPEALELRDGGQAFGGQGIALAVSNEAPLELLIAGRDVMDRSAI